MEDYTVESVFSILNSHFSGRVTLKLLSCCSIISGLNSYSLIRLSISL